MILLRRVIGDALRARRQAQHRTLREVSTAANVSLGYLSEIERGQKEASSELLAAVCDALGARLSELLHEVSSTVASSEVRQSTDPTDRGESGQVPAKHGNSGDSLRTADSGAALVEPREPVTALAAAGGREPATALAAAPAGDRESPEPVALARLAMSPRAAAQPAVPVRAGVATLVDGGVSVTVRRDTPLSATLRTRTIRHDALSRV